MALDARQFRDAIGLFASGVAVIATGEGEDMHAMTANAVSSVSLDPMMVLFCAAKRTRLLRDHASLRGFTVNFLRLEQDALSTYFAGGWRACVPPPFEFLPTACGPRLSGSLASLECETAAILPGGDHWIVLGKVLDVHFGVEPRKPLLFFSGCYRGIDFHDGHVAPPLEGLTQESPRIFYE